MSAICYHVLLAVASSSPMVRTDGECFFASPRSLPRYTAVGLTLFAAPQRPPEVEGRHGSGSVGVAQPVTLRGRWSLLLALLGPIGWAGLVLYLVSDAVLLVLTGGGQLKRLRDQVAERLKGQLVSQADNARPEIEARVSEGLSPLREALVGVAEGEAEQLHELLQGTIAARQQAARDAAARASAWVAALGHFDRAIDELEEISGTKEAVQ